MIARISMLLLFMALASHGTHAATVDDGATVSGAACRTWQAQLEKLIAVQADAGVHDERTRGDLRWLVFLNALECSGPNRAFALRKFAALQSFLTEDDDLWDEPDDE